MDPKTATIAIVMFVAGIAGKTFLTTADAPPLPETQVRYERIDDDRYKQYRINVEEEDYALSSDIAFIKMAESRIAELQAKGELDPSDQKILNNLIIRRDERVQQIEDAKNFGIRNADTALSEVQTP